jgi:hypothetical protein
VFHLEHISGISKEKTLLNWDQARQTVEFTALPMQNARWTGLVLMF